MEVFFTVNPKFVEAARVAALSIGTEPNEDRMFDNDQSAYNATGRLDEPAIEHITGIVPISNRAYF